MDDVAGRPTLTMDLPEVERDGSTLRCRSWTVWPSGCEVWYEASNLSRALSRGLREDPLGLAALAVALHNHPEAARIERLAELLAEARGEPRVTARAVLAAGWRPPLDPDAAKWETCESPTDYPDPLPRDLSRSCTRCGDLLAVHSPERGCAVCRLRAGVAA